LIAGGWRVRLWPVYVKHCHVAIAAQGPLLPKALSRQRGDSGRIAAGSGVVTAPGWRDQGIGCVVRSAWCSQLQGGTGVRWRRPRCPGDAVRDVKRKGLDHVSRIVLLLAYIITSSRPILLAVKVHATLQGNVQLTRSSCRVSSYAKSVNQSLRRLQGQGLHPGALKCCCNTTFLVGHLRDLVSPGCTVFVAKHLAGGLRLKGRKLSRAYEPQLLLCHHAHNRHVSS
jgi:hypothetical protein